MTGRPTMFHKIAKLFGLCGAFSHNIRTPIDTFSHEKLYSAHTEMRADLCKAFSALVSLLISGRQCQMQIVPGLPKITYVRAMLWSKTRQPIHKTCIPLTRSCIIWDSLVGSGVEIMSKRTLQALAVMPLGQRRLISQLQIGHIVGQIKDSGLVVVHCSVILSSRNWCWCRKSKLTCLNILFCALVSYHEKN